jgi:hypothetical protein
MLFYKTAVVVLNNSGCTHLKQVLMSSVMLFASQNWVSIVSGLTLLKLPKLSFMLWDRSHHWRMGPLISLQCVCHQHLVDRCVCFVFCNATQYQEMCRWAEMQTAGLMLWWKQLFLISLRDAGEVLTCELIQYDSSQFCTNSFIVHHLPQTHGPLCSPQSRFYLLLNPFCFFCCWTIGGDGQRLC